MYSHTMHNFGLTKKTKLRQYYLFFSKEKIENGKNEVAIHVSRTIIKKKLRQMSSLIVQCSNWIKVGTHVVKYTLNCNHLGSKT